MKTHTIVQAGLYPRSSKEVLSTSHISHRIALSIIIFHYIGLSYILTPALVTIVAGEVYDRPQLLHGLSWRLSEDIVESG